MREEMQGEENKVGMEGCLVSKYQNFQFCEFFFICLNIVSTRYSPRHKTKNVETPVAHLVLLLLPLFFPHHRHPNYPKEKNLH